jgi:hypothetical protein
MAEPKTPEHKIICPLCMSSDAFTQLGGPEQRKYQLCHHCQLIFMERKFLSDSATEKKRYQAHQNGPQDAGYVQFLNQAITPALPYLNSSMRGLDYGCGPAPTLSCLLGAHGLHCENYDPFFFPELPEGKFDFIFATEVIEHFFNPGQELLRIQGLLKPGGILTIMTELWDSVEKFSGWSYARDNTHVSFYHEKTMEYICAQYGFKKLNPKAIRVSVLKKMVPTHV